MAIRPARPNAPGPGEEANINTEGTQEIEGSIYHFRGAVKDGVFIGQVRVETEDALLIADEVDYDRETRVAQARGHVHLENFKQGDKLDCDHAEYNTESQTGRFYIVTGTSPSRFETRPGMLTTKNPFYFTAEWVDKTEDRYILHNGFLTDCIIPDPWWRLKSKAFDLIPGDRATTTRAWFYVKNVPVFYMPYFYKALGKQARHSGFLTPEFGSNSLRGKMLAGGYYWAINRSYDLTYRATYFSESGLAHQADIRGIVNSTTAFDASIFGTGAGPNTVGGYILSLDGHTILGNGWEGRGELKLLSSFLIRQQSTQSLDEAISSETHSVGVLMRHWDNLGIDIVGQRNINYQSTAPNDSIELRKLPEVEITEREHPIKNWPVWFSLDSTYGLERRDQLLFQTRQFVQRLDLAPTLMTSFHWRGMSIAPSVGVRETAYGSRLENGQLSGENLNRFSRDVSVDLVFPTLERVFDAPGWIGRGKDAKVKHVIEPRVIYRWTSGIDDFNDIIRFDAGDVISNTNELEFDLTNRLLAKDGNGGLADVVTWELRYKRFFDPTFGGAIVPGQRNVVASALDLTGYTFLDGSRVQSPIVSSLKMQTKVGVEWRTDYDPVRHEIVASGTTLDTRLNQLGISAGAFLLRSDPNLAPASNQFRGQVTYGNDNRRGLNYGVSAFYDYKAGLLTYTQAQVTYNTDCCGLSVQYRHFDFGGTLRNENQFRVAFAISNIGSFGTLRKQEKMIP